MSGPGVRLVISADASGVVQGAAQSQTAISGIDQQVQSLTQHAARMGNALVAAFSLRELSRLYLDAAKVSVEMDKLSNTLRFASGNGAEAAKNFAFLRSTVESLGLDLRSTGGAFASLAAAARGTKLEGEGARSIFDAVAKASTAMGLSADEAKGSLLAIQQMISKGTVSAEELRGQLGERLPGAFQIAARAMGVTTAALGKMLEQGSLATDVFLPRFAAQMRLEMGDAARAAADSVQANANRMTTAWTDLQTTIAQSNFNNESLKGHTAALRALSETFKDNKVDAKAWGETLPRILLAVADVALTVGSAFRQAGLDIGWAMARLSNFLQTQREIGEGSIFTRAGVQAREDAARRGAARADAIDAARRDDWKPALRTDFTDKRNAPDANPRDALRKFEAAQRQEAADRALLATQAKLAAADDAAKKRASEAAKAAAKAADELRRANEEALRERVRYLEGLDQQIDGEQPATEKMRDELVLLTQGKKALQDVTRARAEEAATAAERLALARYDLTRDDEEFAKLREIARGLREQIDLRKKLDEATEAQEAAKAVDANLEIGRAHV